MPRRTSLTGAFALSILVGHPSTLQASQEHFQVFDLRLPDRPSLYRPADLNGDDRTDLLIVYTRKEGRDRERRFAIFFQTAQGFAETPDLDFPPPPDAVVFDLADVDSLPGSEIVYFTPRGVSYLTAGSKNPTRNVLVEAPSVFLAAEPEKLPYWDFVRDLNGDGTPELILPQVGRYLIYSTADTRLPSGVLLAGLQIGVRGQGLNRFAVGGSVSTTIGTPHFLFRDLDQDGQTDILAAYADSLCFFNQDASGRFGGPPDKVIHHGFGALADGTETIREGEPSNQLFKYISEVRDLNGDGQIDVTVIKASDETGLDVRTEIQVYYGRSEDDPAKSRSLFDRPPDQVIASQGAQILPDAIDLNADGRMDLVVPTIKTGLTSLIQMFLTRTVNVDVLFYIMGENGRYPDRPSARRKLQVAIDFRRGNTQPVYEFADLNGDGVTDVLTSEDTNELVGFLGSKREVFDAKRDLAFRVHLPGNGDRAKAMNLNGDGKADVVMTYERLDGPELTNLIRVLLSSGEVPAILR